MKKEKKKNKEGKSDIDVQCADGGAPSTMRLRSEQIMKAGVLVIGAAGIISLAAVAPGLLGIFGTYKNFSRSRARHYESPAHIRKIVTKMQRSGLVYMYERRGDTVVRLTEKGRRELSRYIMKEKLIKPLRWDGYWRIIIFDISEKRRYARDRIRMHIEELGFVKLQNSVWVYPYECEELVALLKADFEVGKEVLYIVAREIEGEVFLQEKFNVKEP